MLQIMLTFTMKDDVEILLLKLFSTSGASGYTTAYKKVKAVPQRATACPFIHFLPFIQGQVAEAAA